MAEWIAMDDTTRKALREALGPYGEVGTAKGPALRSALGCEKECAVILPASEDGYARLVTLLHSAPPQQRHSNSEAYEATGFLGLADQLADEPEPTGKKKPWWKKLVE